ncbi:MAG: NAD(P)-dependent oxidoreductase [Pseudomonadota bacterium]
MSERPTGTASAAIGRVALLGTGIMGAPMARNIAAAGFDLSVWNRSPAKAEALSDVARVAATPQAAVAGADAVITMLADGGAVTEVVLGGDLAAAAPGALFIDMSSIAPATARDMAATLKAAGARAMDAPVSGGEPGAIAARLAIMAGGEVADFALAEPLFAAMGSARHVGGHGAGQTAKLANQVIVGITIGAVAEALTLAEAGGADPGAVREAIAGGFAGSPILENHGARMVEGKFEPGALVTTQLKDMENALAAAEAAGIRLPLTERARAAYAELAGPLKLGGKDHNAYFLWLAALNRGEAGA